MVAGGRVTRLVVASVATAAALVGARAATASQTLGDLNVSNLTLAVNAKGEALLTYDRQGGQLRHVLVWGAINALTPNQEVPQVKFQMDYSGGLAKYHNPGYWKSFKNVCKPYDGPGLADGVTACDAPDGSYWAVQAWQRLLPMRGFDPWKPHPVGLRVQRLALVGPDCRPRRDAELDL